MLINLIVYQISLSFSILFWCGSIDEWCLEPI